MLFMKDGFAGEMLFLRFVFPFLYKNLVLLFFPEKYWGNSFISTIAVVKSSIIWIFFKNNRIPLWLFMYIDL